MGEGKTLYYVRFDATPDDLRSWIATLEGKGMLYSTIWKRNREQRLMATPPIAGEIYYNFPLGSVGDKRSVAISVSWDFDKQSTGENYTVHIAHVPLDRDTPILDYPKGILGDFGVTDEQAFIPTNTVIFKTSVIRADKYMYANLPSGTPVIGTLEAKFCDGYIPTFAEASRWATALHRACAAHVSAIEPLAALEEMSMCHWKYTHNGVEYYCDVSADLELRGRFCFTIRRM